MWQYNHTNELYHFGVLGMRWGKRKDRSTTTSTHGTKKARPSDIPLYGKKGAQRIADRQNIKGDSRTTAVQKEFERQVTTGVATLVGAATISYLVTSGKGKQILNAGKNAMDKYNNIHLLDKDGSVIKKYHNSIKVGSAFVKDFLVKR